MVNRNENTKKLIDSIEKLTSSVDKLDEHISVPKSDENLDRNSEVAEALAKINRNLQELSGSVNELKEYVMTQEDKDSDENIGRFSQLLLFIFICFLMCVLLDYIWWWNFADLIGQGVVAIIVTCISRGVGSSYAIGALVVSFLRMQDSALDAKNNRLTRFFGEYFSMILIPAVFILGTVALATPSGRLSVHNREVFIWASTIEIGMILSSLLLNKCGDLLVERGKSEQNSMLTIIISLMAVGIAIATLVVTRNPSLFQNVS